MLTEELVKSKNTSTTRTYIQALGAICRQAGHRWVHYIDLELYFKFNFYTIFRFGDHVETVMPLMMQYARQDDDELKEHVLQVKTVKPVK